LEFAFGEEERGVERGGVALVDAAADAGEELAGAKVVKV
jgi:hypothetical protein